MRALDPDRLLAEAAAMTPPPMEADFMARLMADAQRLQPPLPLPAPPPAAQTPQAAQTRAAQTRPFGRGGLLDALADVFGGRGALAAMMLATVTGLYLGVTQPAILSGLPGLTGQTSDIPLDSLDLMSGSDSLWTETIQ
jgi:hypothetical protein